MHCTLKSHEKGFSLVEMAISLIVIGILLVPALHGYSLYLQDQKRAQTQSAVETASRSINNFLALYGRYPCPADPGAVLGDAEYGMEARNATDDGCDGAILTSVDSDNTTTLGPGEEKVFIGAIPFRQLNLPHQVIYDGDNNQLTYAVTEVLTDELSFSNNKGGIRVEDADGNSVVQNEAGTEESVVHYIIISHGENSLGAVSREGFEVAGCASASALEQENCERTNATFGAGQIGDDFDDIIAYQTSDEVEQWQISENSDLDIHLRPGRQKFAVGVGMYDDTDGFADVEIALKVADDSVLLVEDTALATDTGTVKSNNLCLEDGSKCFNPNLIAGTEADGSLYCPSSEPYLVGVADGQPLCTDEVSFQCPPGKFVSGFDSDGNLVCDSEPPEQCPDQDIATTCGPVRNVSAFFNGGVWYGYGYSGECHMIRADLNPAALQSDIDDIMDDYDPTSPGFYDGDGNCTSGTGCDDALDRIQVLISDYNNETRTTVACGDSSGNSLIRDTFRCESGVWNTSPVRTLEKLNRSSGFSGLGPLYSGGSYPAETSGPSYNPVSPMSVDSSNSNNYRDCWCRQDYRFRRASCTSGLNGARFIIEEHRCPRTDHDWNAILGGWNTEYCGCAASVTPDSETCAQHFGVSSDSVAGNVPFTRTVSCATGSPVSTESGHDISACFCPYQDDDTRPTACPLGTTNGGFIYDGVTYPPGTHKLFVEEWSCPTGTPAPGNPNPGDTPVSSASEAGRYLAEQEVHSEPCDLCDATTPPTIVYESCDSGYVGIAGNAPGYSPINNTTGGRAWEVEWNCATGTYNTIPNGTLKANNCFQLQSCSLREGTPDDVTTDPGAPYLYNDTGPCSFNSGNNCVGGPVRCFKPIGPNQYQNYNGCPCEGAYNQQ